MKSHLLNINTMTQRLEATHFIEVYRGNFTGSTYCGVLLDISSLDNQLGVTESCANITTTMVVKIKFKHEKDIPF